MEPFQPKFRVNPRSQFKELFEWAREHGVLTERLRHMRKLEIHMLNAPQADYDLYLRDRARLEQRLHFLELVLWENGVVV